MKRKATLSLGTLLIALLVNSCAPSGGSGPGETPPASLSAGDSAINRSSTDEIVNKAKTEERPGLATAWGEERKSELTQESFTRDSSKPAGTDIIYYNDPSGIDAMASHTTRVNPMQTAAGDLVEWGVRGGIGFLPTYKEGWRGRRFVAGQKDSSYSIVVKNRCKSALEIVASVDGLDVQDGKSASFKKRGYVVEPGKTLEIEGFRTSYSRVAAFKFSSVSNSYANMRHGNTRNVGVIGLAVFTRKDVNPWTWMPQEINRRETAQPFAQAPTTH
ncbi:MAG: hypothetical protein ACRCXD_17735 [Luteolibacter sp.]